MVEATMSTDTVAAPRPQGGGWRAQFAHPSGTLGWLVGQMMAFKNRERSEWVLSRLNLDEDDRVLEIGFGPGVDIVRASVRAGYVAGVDPSEVMLRQASRRSASAISAGRVNLRLGAMPQLPFENAAFHKAFAINSYQFWPSKIESVHELKRVLAPGGRVAIAVQPRNAGATDATSREVGREIAAMLESAGFTDVQIAFRAMKPVRTACVTATA
jgi:SAM-dependent methyltransferase